MLLAARRVMGLRVSYKDFHGQLALPDDLQWHSDPACRSHVGTERHITCHAFCTEGVLQRIAGHNAGMQETCPHGHTELVVPVFVGVALAGVLYAGPMWLADDGSDGDAPHAALVVAPDAQWRSDRLAMLRALAADIVHHLQRPAITDRNAQLIVDYIEGHLSQPIALADLAQAINRSPSRTGHFIREQFQQTVPQLIQEFRLTRAARLLLERQLPISRIALSVGIADQGYFTRLFRKKFGISPSHFRQERSRGV